jgi:hypothetical protein
MISIIIFACVALDVGYHVLWTSHHHPFRILIVISKDGVHILEDVSNDLNRFDNLPCSTSRFVWHLHVVGGLGSGPCP